MDDSSAAALTELSILIVTWKGDDLLRNCLASLARVCGDAPEIVVVDNAASDTCRALVAGFANARYLASPGNPGFAGGNDLGFALCTRPYVALLNDDTLVRADSFSPLVAYLKAHPETGVVQGTLNLPRLGDVLDDCGVLLTPFALQYHRLFRRPTATTRRENAVVFAGKGAFLVFPRALVAQDLGGVLFHAHFKSYYEETDFCHRVWLAGKEVHFVDVPPIDHLCGQTSGRLNAGEIWTQYVSNTLFSFVTLLAPYGLVRLLPGFALMHALYVAKGVLGGDFKRLSLYAAALRRLWARRAEAAAVRRRVQKTRQISDRALFARILVHPPWRYYLLVARG